MSIDLSGYVLECPRYSGGNNIFTFPINNLITDPVTFGSYSGGRAEYLIITGSLDSSVYQLEIADPNLIFYWTKNTTGVQRFDYDSFFRRWMPLSGIAPVIVGPISNDSRLTVQLPDQTITDSTYSLFIDGASRISFVLKFIGDNQFSDPSTLKSLTVEINNSGNLNFSAMDLAIYANKIISYTGQSFPSRPQFVTSIGSLPEIQPSDYRIFLNPRPVSGQLPRIKIGYRSYLNVEEVASESNLSPPADGTVVWSLDTGRLCFSVNDVVNFAGENVYYDGVTIGSFQLLRLPLSVIPAWLPEPAFNVPVDVMGNDMQLLVFAEKPGYSRVYFGALFVDGMNANMHQPKSLCFWADITTGNCYLNKQDALKYGKGDWTWYYINTIVNLDPAGVSVQLFRSGANGPGIEVQPDFTVSYNVSQQILNGNLSAYPFVTLPTLPILDDNLTYSIQQGNGTFVGSLVNGTDSTQTGFGYFIDFGLKQLKFTNRQSDAIPYILPQAMAEIKLSGAALTEKGIVVTRNGIVLSESEYDIDTSGGLIEFIEPIGSDDINSYSIIGGTNDNTFIINTNLSPNTFDSSVLGKKIYISSGSNSGIYDVISYLSSSIVVVSPNFMVNQQESAMVIPTDETIADRFWTEVHSIPKNFSIYKGTNGPGGTFVKLDISEYAVKSNVGNVSLTTPASPGDLYKITYISIDSSDYGVTSTNTNRTEFALFKISQEQCTSTIGSGIVTFNNQGRTVDNSNPNEQMVVYVNGVTQDATAYTFSAPGTLTFTSPITESPVVIDYYVQEASGGEASIDLQYSPIDYDVLKVIGPSTANNTPGINYIDVGGDQTSTIKRNGAILVDNKEILYIQNSSYNGTTDITHVVFMQSPTNDGTDIKVTDVILPQSINVSIKRPSLLNSVGSIDINPSIGITSSYFVNETNVSQIFASTTNAIVISTDVSVEYVQGTIIDLDGDPYWVLGATYDSSSDTTKINVSTGARRNYITPVIRRSIRPVLNPDSNFNTSKPAYLSRDFTLVLMGNSNKILQKNVDYTLADGGVITLKTNIVFGDVLKALYVAKDMQPEGTLFQFNYATYITPNTDNGLLGQQLSTTYDLYAPDTFFYSVETVTSMIPDLQQQIQANGASPSGPNISDQGTGVQNKNSGNPSPWYAAQHYQNMDVVASKLLKFYNDLINNYEDLLSLIDGRIVGGSSGRFRFDGNFDNPQRDNYADVTNDIDDQVFLYSIGPNSVYGYMYESNSISRLFPSSSICDAAIKYPNVTPSNGDIIGNFNIVNILSIGETDTSPADAYIMSSAMSNGTTIFQIDSSPNGDNLDQVLLGEASYNGVNGDVTTNISGFAIGQSAQIYDLIGNAIGSPVNISSVSTTGVNGVDAYVTVDGVFNTQIGSILQVQNSATPYMLQVYEPNTDYKYDSSSGNITYYSVSPPKQLFPNNPISNNQIVEASISAPYVGTSSKRMPVLDGSELNDFNRPLFPRQRLQNELLYLNEEYTQLNNIGSATVLVDGSLVISGTALVIGDTIKFLNGPNSGLDFTVQSAFGNRVYVYPAVPNVDPVGSDFNKGLVDITSILSNEISILGGTGKSELTTLNSIILLFGSQILSGSSGMATSATMWTDMSTDFTGMDGKLLYVTSGSNSGIYGITTATTNTLNLQYVNLPSISATGSYVIIDPAKLVTDSEFQFIAQFYQNTYAFLQSTIVWSGSISVSGVSGRKTTINNRRTTYLSTVLGSGGAMSGILSSGDSLYDARYQWIDMRVNTQTGLKALWGIATNQQQANLDQIKKNQVANKALTVLTNLT